jgi:CheY-like chemotaxis protein
MLKRPIKQLLLIEGNAGDARLIREMFNEHGALDIELVRARSMSEAEGQLSQRTFDIMLLDLRLKLWKNLTFLQAHQCEEAQGYYFSRPMLPEQFAQLLKNGIPEVILS